ncbi:MAG: cation:proton antiporter [Bacteroidota bacterium]
MDYMLSFLLFVGNPSYQLPKTQKACWPYHKICDHRSNLVYFPDRDIDLLPITDIGNPISYIYCLLFGAIISPTDPMAVLRILKKAKAPKNLEIKIVGESLFNDRVEVVLFLTIFFIAASQGAPIYPVDIVKLFGLEVFVGIALPFR